jgi:hypothetical protein
MHLIMSLNDSVKSLAGRFDTFQRSIDDRLTKLSNEQILLKSKVDFIEKNCLPSTQNKGNLNSDNTSFHGGYSGSTSSSLYLQNNNKPLVISENKENWKSATNTNF